MKKLIVSVIGCFLGISAFAQFVYKIKADSVLITNDSCTAELNLENSTRNVQGFLYNKGNGRTEFRRAVTKLNDSLFIIGADTLALTSQTVGTIGITVDGQGATVSTGSKGFITIPYNCTISNWYVSANVSGSIQFDIKRSGTSIVGSGNKPFLSSAQNGNASVSGWTSVSVTAGDIIEWVVESATTISNATVVLKVSK